MVLYAEVVTAVMQFLYKHAFSGVGHGCRGVVAHLEEMVVAMSEAMY